MGYIGSPPNGKTEIPVESVRGFPPQIAATTQNYL